jgi:hypothetical protein
MLKKRNCGILASILGVMLVFSFIACTGSGGGSKNFTDVEKVENWLAKQKGGASPEDPIPFSVKLNLQNMDSPESNWQKLLTSINTAGLYVALDLSGSTMPTTEFIAHGGTGTGKQFIVSLVLPDSAESILGILYNYFVNLKTAKALKIEWIIGGKGPAGGIVFYDDKGIGNFSGGWRYLEAAPEDMDTALRWVAQLYENYNIAGTDSAIGTGKQNTVLILQVDANAPAAKACADYRGGGFSDWFLPSIGELDLMYKNLLINNIGGFSISNYGYWSSSQDGNYHALVKRFYRGDQFGGGKGDEWSVRAVRAF